MNITDPIYGTFDITEPVLIELINNPSVQRLKGIRQGGSNYLVEDFEEFSRYDHSVGCMLLIRKFGGSLEEQIAGLLHDVSHTALSHVIDFVYKETHSISYHEVIKDKIILSSNIPIILKKHGIDLEHVMEEHNFSLLEQPAPELCADRVDYSLRCLFRYWGKETEVAEYVKSLRNLDGTIVFDNQDAAITYAKDFLDLDQKIFTANKELGAYYVMANIIKKALAKAYIVEEDFLKDDDHLIDKLRKIDDKEIVDQMSKLNFEFAPFETTEEDYDYLLKSKPRFVNPKFIQNGKIETVFEVDPELAYKIELHKQTVSKGRYIKVA